MKLLADNKKVIIIILFVLLCGTFLQLSRSQFVLKSAKNTTEQVVISTAIAEQTRQQTLHNAQYCIIYNEASIRIKNNVEKVLHYMKKTYRTYDVALAGISLTNCHTVLHTTDTLEHLGSIDAIEHYVKNGGKLFLLRTLEPTSHFRVLHPYFGILHHNFFTTTKGVQMTSNLLIGAEGKQFLYESLNDVSLDVVVKDDLPIYMRNEQNLPLAWKSPLQDGYIVLFNANILSEKIARGIIAGLLSIAEESDSYIYPIFNAKTFYIDDFPAPMPEGYHDLIYDEYKRDIPDFFQSIWWPDMIKAANKYELVYTGAMIQTYTNDVTPPFLYEEKTRAVNSLIRYGRELIQGGGELGYHGYNHQSLTMDHDIATSFGYNVWESEAHMVEALQTLNDYSQQAFPAYTITSYVPPSNVLSEEGRRALKAAVPSLVTINSLYAEDDTSRSYIQEFDIGDDQIINMPRISSGYFRTDTNEWSIANAINLHGVFSHFIHPDDVISEDRSNGGWGDMYSEFTSFMGDLQERYPWLRALPATTAASLLAHTLATDVQLETTESSIQGVLTNMQESQHFILRLTRKIKSTDGCTVQKIDANTYLVIAERAQFSIHF